MIETVEELIEVYSLDKEIKKTHPVYRDFVIQLFAIYNLINLRVRLLPIPKDEVKPNNVNIVENKSAEVKPIENKTVENKIIEHNPVEAKPVEKKVIKQTANEQPSSIQKPAIIKNKPVAEVKKEPTVNNGNLENETAKIISAINERLTEQIAHVNIVQNAYVDGNKVNTDDGIEDGNTGSKGGSAINTVNINFAGNNDIQSKNILEENKQVLNNNVTQTKEKPNSPPKFILLDDYENVVYGPCYTQEAVSMKKNVPYGYKWEEYDSSKEYRFKPMNPKLLGAENNYKKKNDFDWITFIVIATIFATIAGIIKCYIL